MKINKKKLKAAVLAAVLLSAGSASAAINMITFQQSVAAGNVMTSTDNGNTWNTITIGGGGIDDGQWGTWGDAGGGGPYGYGPDGDPLTQDGLVYEVYSSSENIPLTRITVSGLTAGKEYNLHGFYWSAYSARMGGTIADQVVGNNSNADTDLTALSMAERNALLVGWDGENAVNSNQAPFHLLQKNFATQVADASGNLYYYITGGAQQLWTGIGYDLVPEPETYALIVGGLALGFVMLRRRIKG